MVDSVLIDPANLPRIIVRFDIRFDVKIQRKYSVWYTCSNIPFSYGFLLVSVFVIVDELLVLQTAYGRENSYGKVSYRIYRESKGWGRLEK